jgi:phosphinothricin acetyltransferase
VHTAAIWNDKTVDTDNRIAWFEARTFAGYPVLVSEENGVVPGMPLSATGAPLTLPSYG